MKNTDLARKIAGDNSKLGRSKADFYPTPISATTALLNNEMFVGKIWEPACGKGDISKVFLLNGFEVYSTDLNDYGFGTPNMDYLDTEGMFGCSHAKVDNIITNPPFNLALDFVLQAKIDAKHKIAMFLKTSFLEGVSRHNMFQDKKFPLKCIYQFSRRVNFGIYNGTHKNGGMIPFAWFVWDMQYKGDPFIKWIK